jgi:tetratricopeptide (TPR) repeat protein
MKRLAIFSVIYLLTTNLFGQDPLWQETAKECYKRGKSLFKEKKYKKAVIEFFSAYLLWPSPGVLLALGNSYWMAGEIKLAAKCYLETIKLCDQKLSLGIEDERTLSKWKKEAKQRLEELADIPEDELKEIKITLGWNLNTFDEFYQQIEEKTQNDQAALEHFNKGKEYETKGEYYLAIENYQKAFMLRPHSELLLFIAQALERLGKVEKAKEYYKKVLELSEKTKAEKLKKKAENSLAKLKPKEPKEEITSLPPKLKPKEPKKEIKIKKETESLPSEIIKKTTSIRKKRKITKKKIKTWPWITLGTSAISLMVGTTLYLSAKSDFDKYKNTDDPRHFDELAESIKHKSTTAITLFCIGGATAIVSAILFYSKNEKSEPPLYSQILQKAGFKFNF